MVYSIDLSPIGWVFKIFFELLYIIQYFNFSGLTLNKLLRSIEEDEEHITILNEVDIAIIPPTNACEDLTDEDSDNNDTMTK